MPDFKVANDLASNSDLSLSVLARSQLRLHHRLSRYAAIALCKLPSLHLHFLNAACLLSIVTCMHWFEHLRLLRLTNNLRALARLALTNNDGSGAWDCVLLLVAMGTATKALHGDRHLGHAHLRLLRPLLLVVWFGAEAAFQ